MRTVGQILKEVRESKYYTLDEIEKATKIRKELLQALEADDYNKLPPPTFVQGFIKNYGKFLKLDSEKLLAVFRREFADHKHPPRVLDAWTNPLDKRKFRVTPAKALAGVVLVLIVAFLIYLWFEFRFLVGAPFLEISQPSDQETIAGEVVRVVGRTDPEAKVTINNQEVTVALTGSFSEEIKLTESVNTIEVKAVSKNGQESSVDRTVYVK